LQVTGYRLQVAGCRLQGAGCRLQVIWVQGGERERMKSIEKVILAIFCLFIILVPYFRNISKHLLMLGILFWVILGILRHKKHFYRIFFVSNFLTKPVLIFLGAAVLSVIFSMDPYNSQKIFFSRHIIYFLFFLMGSNLAARFNTGHSKDSTISIRNLYFITAAILLSGAVLSIGGIRDYILFRPGRLYTSFGRDIIFAMLPIYFVFFIPFSISLVLFSKKWGRACGLLSLVLLVPCWIFAGSRAGWIAVILSVFSMIILFKKGKKYLAAFFILITVTIGVFFIFHSHTHDKINNFFNEDTFGGRPQLMMAAVNIFKEHPLFGAGLGMYGNICRDNPPTPVFHLHVHNTYLEVLSESGIFGFLALLWIFIVFFKKTFRLIKSGVLKDEVRAIFIGLWGMIASMLVFEIFGSCILVGMQAAPLFWFLLGFAVQSYHKAKSNQA
jgi:hypothetical protein